MSFNKTGVFLAILIVIQFLSTSQTVFAARGLMEPKQISTEIKDKGMKRFLSEHPLEDKKFWQILKTNVSAGKEQWLGIALKMRNQSDVGKSELLDSFIGNAIKANPVAALKIIGEENHSGACEAIIPENSDTDNSASYIKELKTRVLALDQVKDSELDRATIAVKKKCKINILRAIANLEESKK